MFEFQFYRGPRIESEIIQSKMELENGQKIPQVGFGTWPMKGDECFDAVCSAIKIGYRFVPKFIEN